jgi:hypothetical protein
MKSRAGLKRVSKTVRTKHGTKKQNFWVRNTAAPAAETKTIRMVHVHEQSFKEVQRQLKLGTFVTVGALGGALAGYTVGGHVGRVYGYAQTGLKTGGRVGAWAGRNLGAAGGTLAGTSLGYAVGRHYVR